MYSEKRMKKWWVLMPVLFVLGALFFGWVVMSLWNAILVPAAGANVITYWQGIGLLVLSRILFGGFRGRPWGAGMHGKDRWRHLSPEEKQQMKAAWKQRCGQRWREMSNEEKANAQDFPGTSEQGLE